MEHNRSVAEAVAERLGITAKEIGDVPYTLTIDCIGISYFSEGVARIARIQFEGAIYHVSFRGVERRDIYGDDRDRLRFLESLAERVEEYRVRLYLYCLMSNHAHLLVETPKGNLSAFMGSLLTSYSTYFNRRRRRSGHLLQGRYTSPLVEGDRYLLKLSRYIHLNPVMVRRLRRLPVGERRRLLRKYKWSSYRAYAGLTRPEAFVEYRPVLEWIAQGRGRREERYRKYVESGLAETDEELAVVMRSASLAVGSQKFQSEVRRRHEREAGRRLKREDRALRRGIGRVEPERIVELVCGHYGRGREELRRHRKRDEVKPVWSALLVRHAGLTQREAAEWLGRRSGAAVCVQLRRLREQGGERMRRKVREIERKFKF